MLVNGRPVLFNSLIFKVLSSEWLSGILEYIELEKHQRIFNEVCKLLSLIVNNLPSKLNESEDIQLVPSSEVQQLISIAYLLFQHSEPIHSC